MISQPQVSVANGNFSVVKYITLVLLFVSIIHDLPLAIQLQKHLILKLQPQHKEDLLCTAPGFPKCKRATDHCFILAVEAIGFLS